MSDYKSFFLSKTVWGGGVAAISGLALLFGYNFGMDDQAAVVQSIEKIVAEFGSLFAVYGRVMATKMIGSR